MKALQKVAEMADYWAGGWAVLKAGQMAEWRADEWAGPTVDMSVAAMEVTTVESLAAGKVGWKVGE